MSFAKKLRRLKRFGIVKNFRIEADHIRLSLSFECRDECGEPSLHFVNRDGRTRCTVCDEKYRAANSMEGQAPA